VLGKARDGFRDADLRLHPLRVAESRACLTPCNILETEPMALIETFWMACDSTESSRVEYGPFATRAEAEATARRLRLGYLLRYEHLLGEEDEIEDVRSVFIELGTGTGLGMAARASQWHTRCASCGESAGHQHSWQAEVWADIHEFENMRHLVRLFERTDSHGLREIAHWRKQSA
jgi:hypothetical protein